MLYKKRRFVEILEEEIRYVRLLKLIKKEREKLIKEDIKHGSRNDLLGMWRDYAI